MRRLFLTLLAAVLWLTPGMAEEKKYTLPLDLSVGVKLKTANYLTDWHYQDPTIEMIARDGMAGDTKFWVAEVEIRDPTQLRTMPAYSFTSSSQAEGSKLSRRANAVLACNGDYWWREVDVKGNYVLRQGQLYMHHLTGRSDLLLVDEDGDFHIIHQATEAEAPLPETEGGPVYYEGKRIYNGFCFGPAIVEEGKALTIEPDERIISEKKTARMALCQMGKLKYAVVCCARERMTLQEFADLVASLGAVTAYNLDGGGSTMMFTRDRKINVNSTTREIADIIYFASAWTGED